ncbi:MAG: ArsA-related P-loop ATPase, partial [Acidobacteriota bacterium]
MLSPSREEREIDFSLKFWCYEGRLASRSPDIVWSRPPMRLLDTLSRRKLLVVTGKGGVGKTAVSAVLGRKLSQSG